PQTYLLSLHDALPISSREISAAVSCSLSDAIGTSLVTREHRHCTSPNQAEPFDSAFTSCSHGRAFNDSARGASDDELGGDRLRDGELPAGKPVLGRTGEGEGGTDRRGVVDAHQAAGRTRPLRRLQRPPSRHHG